MHQLLTRAFRRWPIVSAEVIHSRLLDQLGPDGEEMLEAIVHCKYEFRGKEYLAEQPFLRSADLFPSRAYESGLANKYTKGNFYNIRVNPRYPENAYFEVLPLSKITVFVAPTLSVIIIGAYIAYFKFVLG